MIDVKSKKLDLRNPCGVVSFEVPFSVVFYTEVRVILFNSISGSMRNHKIKKFRHESERPRAYVKFN